MTATPEFWAGRPVCVFGGTGFLGRHLVSRLLDCGARVRTLSLGGPPLDPHPHLDARTGDVADPAAVRAAVEGTGTVFLAAGPVGVGPELSRGMGAHPDALASVRAALPTEARLVLTSSIVAVGATLRGEVLNEDSPFPNADLNVGYVQAKRRAEEAALAAAPRQDVVVVNPGYLFGPNDLGTSVMGELCLRFWRGTLALPPAGGINGVDVRDAAEGHLLAAERGARGRRYILGGENVHLTDLYAALARAAVLRRVVLPSFRPPLPSWAFWLIAAFAELGRRLTGRNPEVSFELVRMLRRHWFVDSARARGELGFTTRPLAETLADTFAWHAARTHVAPRGLNRLWLRRA